MNIGFFSETYLPEINGVTTSMESFRKELERAGHTVYVFAPGDELIPAPWKKPKRERRVFRFSSFSYPLYKSIRVAIPINVPISRKIPKLKLDLVHSHTPFSMGLFAQGIARQQDIPHVHTYHTLYPEYAKIYFPGFKKWNERNAERLSALFCNAVTEIISPSDGIKRKLRTYGITKPITTVPTGIDREYFQSAGSTAAVRAKYGIPKSAPVLITVARLGREKSVDYLLRSFKQLLKQRPDAYYLIVGEGPARNELETLARELGVAEQTIFTGLITKRPDVIRLYRTADVFVFASKTDTQCLTLLEGAATGLPLVARYDKPLETALKDRKNGFFVKSGEAGFAKTVEKILDNKTLAKRLGKNSIAVAKAQSAEKRTRELLAVYDRAIATEEALPDINAFQAAVKRVRSAFR
ncbi:glycosyltransferase family 4 protein [Patescibacteria group bacterium]|nr:glycosyltransferase family 4 protein [Patescibacteria group bacterium]